MIDAKDIEIAKLKGQVEALERMLLQMLTHPAPVVTVPIALPPTVNPGPFFPTYPGIQPWGGPTFGVCSVPASSM